MAKSAAVTLNSRQEHELLRESFAYRFVDLSRDDDAICIVRQGGGAIALDLALRRGGELSVTLDLDAASALVDALREAIDFSRRGGSLG